MNKPITIQIQIEPFNLTEIQAREIVNKMHEFADTLHHYGNVRQQMYLGPYSYDGEPL